MPQTDVLMKIGRYDQKVKFISEGSITDEYGGVLPTEIVELETWARIWQSVDRLPERRTLEELQMRLPAVYRIAIQIRKGFEPTVNLRVIWRGETYNIITSPVVEDIRTSKEWIFDICQSIGYRTLL